VVAVYRGRISSPGIRSSYSDRVGIKFVHLTAGSGRAG
jgi:hypothetical protein